MPKNIALSKTDLPPGDAQASLLNRPLFPFEQRKHTIKRDLFKLISSVTEQAGPHIDWRETGCRRLPFLALKSASEIPCGRPNVSNYLKRPHNTCSKHDGRGIPLLFHHHLVRSSASGAAHTLHYTHYIPNRSQPRVDSHWCRDRRPSNRIAA